MYRLSAGVAQTRLVIVLAALLLTENAIRSWTESDDGVMTHTCLYGTRADVGGGTSRKFGHKRYAARITRYGA